MKIFNRFLFGLVSVAGVKLITVAGQNLRLAKDDSYHALESVPVTHESVSPEILEEANALHRLLYGENEINIDSNVDTETMEKVLLNDLVALVKSKSTSKNLEKNIDSINIDSNNESEIKFDTNVDINTMKKALLDHVSNEKTKTALLMDKYLQSSNDEDNVEDDPYHALESVPLAHGFVSSEMLEEENILHSLSLGETYKGIMLIACWKLTSAENGRIKFSETDEKTSDEAYLVKDVELVNNSGDYTYQATEITLQEAKNIIGEKMPIFMQVGWGTSIATVIADEPLEKFKGRKLYPIPILGAWIKSMQVIGYKRSQSQSSKYIGKALLDYFDNNIVGETFPDMALSLHSMGCHAWYEFMCGQKTPNVKFSNIFMVACDVPYDMFQDNPDQSVNYPATKKKTENFLDMLAEGGKAYAMYSYHDAALESSEHLINGQPRLGEYGANHIKPVSSQYSNRVDDADLTQIVQEKHNYNYLHAAITIYSDKTCGVLPLMCNDPNSLIVTISEIKCIQVGDWGVGKISDELYLEKGRDVKVWPRNNFYAMKSGEDAKFSEDDKERAKSMLSDRQTYCLKESDNGPDDLIGCFAPERESSPGVFTIRLESTSFEPGIYDIKFEIARPAELFPTEAPAVGGNLLVKVTAIQALTITDGHSGMERDEIWLEIGNGRTFPTGGASNSLLEMDQGKIYSLDYDEQLDTVTKAKDSEMYRLMEDDTWNDIIGDYFPKVGGGPRTEDVILERSGRYKITFEYYWEGTPAPMPSTLPLVPTIAPTPTPTQIEYLMQVTKIRCDKIGDGIWQDDEIYLVINGVKKYPQSANSKSIGKGETITLTTQEKLSTVTKQTDRAEYKLMEDDPSYDDQIGSLRATGTREGYYNHRMTENGHDYTVTFQFWQRTIEVPPNKELYVKLTEMTCMIVGDGHGALEFDEVWVNLNGVQKLPLNGKTYDFKEGKTKKFNDAEQAATTTKASAQVKYEFWEDDTWNDKIGEYIPNPNSSEGPEFPILAGSGEYRIRFDYFWK